MNYIDDKTVDIFSICFPWEEEEAKTMKKLISSKTIKLKEMKLNSETNVSLIFILLCIPTLSRLIDLIFN